MTEPESSTPELSPAQEEAVRRLLAEARHTGAVPEAVAERLDRVLVGLVDERWPAPVVHLADHRRRRAAARILVAAAAVVAVGVGLGQLTGGLGDDSSGDSSNAADSAAQSPESPGDYTAESGVPANGAPTRRAPEADLVKLPVIHPQSFRDEVADRFRLYSATDSTAAKALAAYCPIALEGERALAVSYEGELATLVYRAPRDDVQRVDLYRCDPPGLVRSVVIPGP